MTEGREAGPRLPGRGLGSVQGSRPPGRTLEPVILRSSLLSRFEWLDHGFGTRAAALTQDAMASLQQIHSAIALEANGSGCAGEGDALISRERGVPLSVRTADCFPILLVDAGTRTVAAVHAGWRGTAARVIPAALEKMNATPAHTYAAIGPGIGACCYAVGDDVGRRFGLSGAGRVDLAGANRSQLIAAGVPESNIDALGGCTYCDAERFYSYRREGDAAGRMISYIGLR
jgi:purine-nucleoside/S-methyl-5'-thioadenosine phosphorylase / adenosine deaminase